ncbi:amino acid ABC transporter permease, partial [Streptococcus agalactiae]
MNFSFLPQYWSYFNYGVMVTIMISTCVVFFGTIIGVLIALVKRTNLHTYNS